MTTLLELKEKLVRFYGKYRSVHYTDRQVYRGVCGADDD